MEIKLPTRDEKVATHTRGIKIVLLSSMMGAVAGILSSPYFLSTPHVSFSFLILALAVYAQKFIFPVMGVKSSEFAFKDWFFVTFMTFCFWYIMWTIILNPPFGSQPQLFGPFF